jgi:NAD(P)-dependent dehydrogenase (short-subunit alcohol dehydrogenase family)
VSSKASLQAAVSTVESQTLFINLLIAKSGYLGEVTNMAPRPPGQNVSELREELWNKTTFEDASKVVSTNITGSYFIFSAFLGLMGAGNTHANSVGKSGLLQSQFISTTSFGGLCRAEAPSYVYNASKAALNHLTQTLSSEYAKHSIRANAIAPGMFVTEMTEVNNKETKLFRRLS